MAKRSIPPVNAKILAGQLPKLSPALAAEEFIREQPMLYEAAKQLAPNEDALAWLLIGMAFVYSSLKVQREQERE